MGADEVVNDSLLQSDIRAGAITNDEVLDNSLIGADIDESTLTSTATATFGFVTSTVLPNNGSFAKVASKNLSGGAYAVTAYVNMNSGAPFDNDHVVSAGCELRNGNTFIGGTTDRRVIPDEDAREQEPLVVRRRPGARGRRRGRASGAAPRKAGTPLMAVA